MINHLGNLVLAMIYFLVANFLLEVFQKLPNLNTIIGEKRQEGKICIEKERFIMSSLEYHSSLGYSNI